HPSMQAEKRRRIDAADVYAAVVYVPIDFRGDSLAAALAGAGHDRARRTVWIWEGVTMYLTPEATRATLAAVADASAPGSELAITYCIPSRVDLPYGVGALVRAFFASLGEPLRGTFTHAAMGELLDSLGF